MSRSRFMHALSLLAIIIFAGVGLVGVSAQEATPAPAAPPLADVATPNGTLPGNPEIQLVKVAGGLADPVNVAAPDDGSGRVFVVERTGTIRIIDKDGQLLPDPFLDISSLVKTDFLEQGLLGLAFHPNLRRVGSSTSTMRISRRPTRYWRSSTFPRTIRTRPIPIRSGCC